MSFKCKSIPHVLLSLHDPTDLSPPPLTSPPPVFQSLSADLAGAKDQTRVTRNDILHLDNVSKGRDKYKTLKQIRQGNTKQRVDMFEAM